MKRHVQNVHEKNVRFIECPHCHKTFPSVGNTRRHIKNVHQKPENENVNHRVRHLPDTDKKMPQIKVKMLTLRAYTQVSNGNVEVNKRILRVFFALFVKNGLPFYKVTTMCGCNVVDVRNLMVAIWRICDGYLSIFVQQFPFSAINSPSAILYQIIL